MVLQLSNIFFSPLLFKGCCTSGLRMSSNCTRCCLFCDLQQSEIPGEVMLLSHISAVGSSVIIDVSLFTSRPPSGRFYAGLNRQPVRICLLQNSCPILISRAPLGCSVTFSFAAEVSGTKMAKGFFSNDSDPAHSSLPGQPFFFSTTAWGKKSNRWWGQNYCFAQINRCFKPEVLMEKLFMSWEFLMWRKDKIKKHDLILCGEGLKHKIPHNRDCNK